MPKPRAGRVIGASSVREHGGMLYCLTAAYDETGEPRYLEAARRLAHDAMGRIDRKGQRTRNTRVEATIEHDFFPYMVNLDARLIRLFTDVELLGVRDSLHCPHT